MRETGKICCIKLLFIILGKIYVFIPQVYTQVDTIHYLPPLYYTGDNNSDYDRQYIILSTYESVPFDVTIRTRDGSYSNTVTLSQASPVQINMGQRFSAVGLIGPSQKNTVLDDEGLIISGPEPFFVNQTHKTSLQACIITSKGSVGLGKEFYSGHMYSVMEGGVHTNNRNKRRAHLISVMASENNTFVTVSNPRVKFDGQTLNTFTVVLQAGQSYVITKDFHNSNLDDITINHFNGTRITSNKPIVVTSGSWTSGANPGLRDIGVDQIVPVEIVGEEYIAQRGNGSNSVERLIVVSTEGGNGIYLNGNGTAYGNLTAAGDYLVIPESRYTSNNTLYLKADKPVYVYQSLAGSTSDATTGMMFIPRLSCNVSKKVQISYADFLGNPAIKLITQTGSAVQVNGNTLSGAMAITGNPNWEAYTINESTLSGFNPGPNWNFTIESTGALNAGLTIESGAIGAGGYYSGFGTLPEISFNPVLEMEGFCAGNAELKASGYSTYNWFKDGHMIPGETSDVYYPNSPGRYKVVGVTDCAGKPSYTYPSTELVLYPCLTIVPADFSVTEGDAANPNAEFTINLSHPWDEDDVSFDYYTEAGDASQGSDFENTTGSAVISSGDTLKTINVPILNDLLAEDAEDFSLHLTNPVNAVISADSGVCRIIDDADPKPVINLESSKVVNENAGPVNFEISLSIPSGQVVTADYEINDNTAQHPDDFVSTGYSGTLTFFPGEQNKTINMNIVDDNIDEPGADEQFSITLLNVINAQPGNLNSTCTITDNDDTPALTLSAAGATEGDTVTINGSLDHGSSRDIIYRYYTLDNTALSPDDFNALVPTKDTLQPGQTSFTNKIVTTDDVIMEGSEQFNYVLVNLQNAVFTDGSTTDTLDVNIYDNEGLPQITVADGSGTEGANVKFAIDISHPSSTDISFNIQTNNQTAETTDYSGYATPQLYTVTAGITKDTIQISLTEDTDEEGNEQFELVLSSVSANAQFSDSIATGTIVDNDETPVAVKDVFATNEDATLIENVFSNDYGFGDPPVTIISNTSPSHGTVSLDNNTGAIQYIPDANYNGKDSLEYTLADDDGDVSSNWVVITVLSVNDIPDAVNDVFNMAENTSLDSTVIFNDTGLGDGYTCVVTSGVTNGILNMTANGAFEYTPDNQYFGTDHFTYELTDGNGDKTSASVEIEISYSNDYDPVALNDTISTPEDVAALINVLDNDYDLDGNVTIDVASVFIESPPSNGSTSADPMTGIVTYTPDADYQGADWFEYSIRDDGGKQSANARVIISVTADNDVPVAVCHDTVTAYIDNSGSYALNASMLDDGSYDTDGDPLTYILSKSSFDCTDKGYANVTLTVKDPLLAQDQCVGVLHLQDSISPVMITTVSDTSLYTTSGTCGMTVNYSIPQFQDNCDGTVNGNLTSGYSSGSVFPIGTTTVSYSYTDASGNGPVENSFNITVIDTISPTLNCTDYDLFANSGSDYLVSGTGLNPVSGDNCSFTIVHDFNGGGNSLDGKTLLSGLNTINWSVTDASGNTKNCIQEIHVYDPIQLDLVHSDDNDTICIGETVVFTANASGGMGTLDYTFLRDNNPVTMGVSGNTYTVSDLNEGEEIKVKVEDLKGNSAESSPFTFTVMERPEDSELYRNPNQ